MCRTVFPIAEHAVLSTPDHVLDKEAFEYGYRAFIEAIEALAEEPAQQVAINGNCNTAFELVFDAKKGAYLLSSPASYLSEQQANNVRAFLGRLERPIKYSAGAGDPDPKVRQAANLSDMHQALFTSLRAAASELLIALSVPTALNRAYFSSL